ncbi:hypothetical protein PIB30_067800, partial [Stylosanthes scabra]|nr:hypothetical protein [Stylosanthes scabra]
MGSSNIKVKESPIKSEKEKKRSISKNLRKSIVNESLSPATAPKTCCGKSFQEKNSQQSDKCIGSSNTTGVGYRSQRGKGINEHFSSDSLSRSIQRINKNQQ